MPTRPRPSSWQPAGPGILVEFYPRYTPELIQNILSLVPVSNSNALRVLQNRVFVALSWLNMALHDEGRPTVPQKTAALASLNRIANDFLKGLRGLDVDTAEALKQAAGEDPQNIQIEPDPESLGGYIGVDRFSRAKTSVEDIMRWTTRAEQNLAPARKGSPRHDALRRAIESLRDAWTEATGKEPTLAYDKSRKKTYGPFLEFVEMALTPVTGNVKFERICRTVLYG